MLLQPCITLRWGCPKERFLLLVEQRWLKAGRFTQRHGNLYDCSIFVVSENITRGLSLEFECVSWRFQSSLRIQTHGLARFYLPLQKIVHLRYLWNAANGRLSRVQDQDRRHEQASDTPPRFHSVSRLSNLKQTIPLLQLSAVISNSQFCQLMPGVHHRCPRLRPVLSSHMATRGTGSLPLRLGLITPP